MSTKRLKDALGLLEQYISEAGGCDHPVNICVCEDRRALADAREELEAIEKAAADLTRLKVHGFDYMIAERFYDGDASDAATKRRFAEPDVRAWSSACDLLASIASETK